MSNLLRHYAVIDDSQKVEIKQRLKSHLHLNFYNYRIGKNNNKSLVSADY